MDDREQFAAKNERKIQQMGRDEDLRKATSAWFAKASDYAYSYHFRWMGIPIIQFPQDIVAMQEIIWEVKPDLIIETGIARGGSLVFYASMLELLGKGAVLGIDVDIRPHNREAVEAHPMARRIQMIEASSVTDETLQEVCRVAAQHDRVLVALDSNHTHDHVLRELELYAPLVSPGSYCVVFDTIIEDMPPNSFPNRPWDIGDNPKTAAREFLKSHPEFEIDHSISDKLQITVAPDGYLRRKPAE